MVVVSTFSGLELLLVANMKKMNDIYMMPHMGCLLGVAYQKLVSKLEDAIRKARLDVTAPEYLILRSLYTHDGLQQCEIGEMVGKDKGAVSRSVAGMVRKGLVTTETVSYRCQRVWLSQKGLEIRPKIMDIASERHESLRRLATGDELKTFEKVLRAIAAQ